MPYSYSTSDYLATAILNHFFHNTPLPVPDTVQLSLHMLGGPDLDGENVGEVDDDETGYERLVVHTGELEDADFSEVTFVDGWRVITNVDVLDWGEADVAWHDGSDLIDAIGIWDDQDPPNLLLKIVMDPGIEINPGPVVVPPTAITIEM